MCDNTASYSNLSQDEINELINKAICIPEHTHIARAFKSLYHDKLMCTNSRNKPWYIKEGTEWKHLGGSLELIRFIDENFTHVVEYKQSDILKRFQEAKDPQSRAGMKYLLIGTGKLLSKLRSRNFKEELCRELKIYFMNANPDFI